MKCYCIEERIIKNYKLSGISESGIFQRGVWYQYGSIMDGIFKRSHGNVLIVTCDTDVEEALTQLEFDKHFLFESEFRNRQIDLIVNDNIYS